jgi:hypothetical protein
VWLLSKALYGLRESPRAWSLERDRVLQDLLFTWHGEATWLEQCKSEPGVWRVHHGTLNERRQSILRTVSQFNDVEGEGVLAKGRAWIDRLDDALRGLDEELSVKPELVGWVLAYVDDLLMVTWKDEETMRECLDEEDQKFPGDKLQEEVESRWKCGKSQVLTPEGPLEYTGIEVREFEEEYHVSQMKYTKSLLAKNGMLKNVKKSDIIFDANECEEETKLEIYKEQYPKNEIGRNSGEQEFNGQESEDEDGEGDEDDERWMKDDRYAGLSEEEKLVKRAQEGVGALIWLCKTRIDLVYSINRAAAYTLNEPRRAIRMFRRILRFLAGTQSHGLVFRSEITKDRDLPDELKALIGNADIAILTDISFAPRKETRSIQMLIAVIHGAPVFWKSNKQGVSAQSTAEAELGGSSDGLIVLKGIEALFYELIQGGESLFSRNSQSRLGLDNSAAVALGTGSVSSNYRNRHLKLKATGLVEATERGQIQLNWITGEQMLADIGTKTLGRDVLKRLSRMCNMRSVEELEEEREKGQQNRGGATEIAREIPMSLKFMLASLLLKIAEGRGEIVMQQEIRVINKTNSVVEFAMNKWKEGNDIFKIIGIVCVGMLVLWMLWKCVCCVGKMYECKCEKRRRVEDSEDTIYWSPGGSVYHDEAECRALKNVAKVESVRLCKICQKKRPIKEKSE